MATGPWAWHVHHRTLLEQLNDANGLVDRQSFIKHDKPYKERARRLRLLKIVKNQELMVNLEASSALAYNLPRDVQKKMRAGIRRAVKVLHDHECKKCPWDGRTIFPKAKVK